jgi:hypothetical protein
MNSVGEIPLEYYVNIISIRRLHDITYIVRPSILGFRSLT